MTKPPIMQLDDPWIDRPAVQWVISNGKNIAYGALVILLVLITVYRFMAGATQQKERDFITAENDAQALEVSDNPNDSLNSLLQILVKHPELESKYEGLIAQTLLTEGKVDEALPYGERTLDRYHNITPEPFSTYSRNSLLIAQDKKQEALDLSIGLKENIQDPTLYLFNLVRIALLQRDLKLKTEEMQTWDEIQSIKNGTHKIKLNSTELSRILSHYEMQGTTLQQFSEK